eukprot:COSAG06_NODE_48161_length_334_cov_0.663830_1_plen_27_part_10
MAARTALRCFVLLRGSPGVLRGVHVRA